jgi:hypothetical protein
MSAQRRKPPIVPGPKKRTQGGGRDDRRATERDAGKRGVGGANSKGTPHDERFGKLIKEFAPLRDNGSERLCLRILSHPKGPRVDIRKYVIHAAAFTKAGVSLAPEEFEVLTGKRRKKIMKLLRQTDE